MDFPITELLPATRLFLAVLLHFVWQATLAVALIAMSRSLIHPKYCRIRYVVSVVALGAVLLFPLVTFGYYALNTAATQSLLSIAVSLEDAPLGNSPAPSLIGQFESKFQLVFAWFDNHCLFWMGGWLVGFALFVLRLSVSLGHCFRLRRSRKPLPPRVQKLAVQLRTKLGLTQKIIIGVSQEVTQAVAIGIVRPVVLIPTAWITQMPISAIEAVLAHELAHVKRWDLWVNFLQRLAETVFFFHPLVWWLSKKISNEREVCCDQLAVRITGQPMRYVETLASVAGDKNMDEFEFQFGTAFSGGKNMNLLRRAKLILEPTSVNSPAPFRTLALVAVVGVLVSYGSFAFSAAATAAISQRQDHDRDQGHDHDHDQELDRDHDRDDEIGHNREHQDGRTVESRRIRRDGQQDNQERAVVRGAPRSRGGDGENDVRNQLFELLHRNDLGGVSQQEFAQQLRQLADDLESRNKTVRWAENVRRDVEIRQRQVDQREMQDRVQNRRIKVDPRVGRPIVVGRENVGPRERSDRPDPRNDERFGSPKVVQGHPRRVEGRNPLSTLRGRENPDDHSVGYLRNLPFGKAGSSDGELGQVLRELKSEVQQLRNEVNRLKSERTSPRAENIRGTLRGRFGSDVDGFQRPVEVRDQKRNPEEQAKYRLQSSDNRSSANRSNDRNRRFGLSAKHPGDEEKLEIVIEETDFAEVVGGVEVEEVEEVEGVEGVVKKSKKKNRKKK